MLEKMELRRQRNFNEIVGDSLHLLKREWKPFMKSLLVIGGPAILLGSIFYYFYFKMLFSNIAISASTGQDPIPSRSDVVAFGFGGLFLLFATMLLYVMSMAYFRALEENNNESPPVSMVWKFTRRKFFPVTGASIIIVIGSYSALFIPILLLAWIPFLLVIVFLGVIVLFVYIFTKLSLSQAAIVFDDAGVFQSMSNSWNYSRDHFWPTLGSFFVPSLIANFAVGVVMVPFMILGMLISMHVFGDVSIILQQILMMIGSVLLVMVSFMAMALPLLGLSLQYLNLSEKVNGVGLISKIDQLTLDASGPSDVNEETY